MEAAIQVCERVFEKHACLGCPGLSACEGGLHVSQGRLTGAPAVGFAMSAVDLQTLQAKGHPARILAPRNNLHPVVYGSHATRQEALDMLARVRAEGAPQAWLLVR